MLISIIMPVYNSEKYIEQSIKSVLCQTYPDFELIIIDDGSTDNSGLIAQKISSMDSRIKYFYKNNGGVCSARNIGIKMSCGQYICFIDNDDEYYPNYLETLVENILLTNADIIKCGRCNIAINSDQTILSRKLCRYESNLYDKESFKKDYFKIRESGILSSVWNGVYKKDIIIHNDIWFDEKLLHGNEDMQFNANIFLVSKKIGILKDVLYIHYYRYSHSTSMHFYSDQIDSRYAVIELEKKIVSEKDYKCLSVVGKYEILQILSKCDNKMEVKHTIKKLRKNKLRGSAIAILRNSELSLSKRIQCLMICARLESFIVKAHRRKGNG